MAKNACDLRSLAEIVIGRPVGQISTLPAIGIATPDWSLKETKAIEKWTHPQTVGYGEAEADHYS